MESLGEVAWFLHFKKYYHKTIIIENTVFACTFNFLFYALSPITVNRWKQGSSRSWIASAVICIQWCMSRDAILAGFLSGQSYNPTATGRIHYILPLFLHRIAYPSCIFFYHFLKVHNNLKIRNKSKINSCLINAILINCGSWTFSIGFISTLNYSSHSKTR
jgi:hypothetical protein